MKIPSIFLLILLTLALTVGCSTVEEPASAVASQIQVSFDGEICQVTGVDAGPINGPIFIFENQSDSDAKMITLLLKENQSPDEIFQSFEPGSTEFPEGAFKHGSSRSVSSGGSIDNVTSKFYEGNYAILCVNTATQGLYLGGWFTNQ